MENKYKKAKVVVKKIEGKEVKLEQKQVPTFIKSIDEDKGVVEVFVSVFGNVDSYGEIVDYGAFSAFLGENFPRYPKIVWAHDWSQPIGKVLEWKEVPPGDSSLPESIRHLGGLWIKHNHVFEVQRAKESYALLKAGVITDYSFGYYVMHDSYDEDGFRHLKEIAIYEASPVLVGANPKTEVVDIKSKEKAKKEDNPEPEDIDTQEDTPQESDPDLVSTDNTTTTTSDDSIDENPTEEDSTVDQVVEEDEEKDLKVLVLKCIDAVQNAVAEKASVINELEALQKALENIVAKSDDTIPEVDQRSIEDAKEDNHIARLVLKDVRRADRALERALRRAKITIKSNK